MVPCQHIDRLPRGTDREFGAGYAMAMAAAGATVLYYLLVAVAVVVIVAAGGIDSATAFLAMAPVGLALGAFQTAAIVAPLAFVSGVVAFWVVPADRRFAGPLAGLLATLLTYVIAALLLAVVFLSMALWGGPTPSSMVGAGGSAVAVVAVAFVATSWATLPLGVIAGTLYERSRA